MIKTCNVHTFLSCWFSSVEQASFKMLTLLKISLLFSLFLPSVHSVCEQFPVEDIRGDHILAGATVTDITDRAIIPRAPLGCASTSDVGRFDVFVSGQVIVSHSRDSDEPVITFNVFNVDINDIAFRNVSYRYSDIADVNIKNCAINSFNEFYPRENITEGSFNPTKILLVTWNLTQSILSSGGNEISDHTSPRNIFQMAYIHDGSRGLIFYLYNDIQWGKDTVNIGLQACGSSSSGRWNNPPTGQTAASQSNLATTRRGEWILYLNGTGHLIPAVVCKVGCSLTNGYCTERDTCLCRPGWSGELCTIAVCCQGCVNGLCTSPDTCECNEGWLGSSCDTARCYSACINGECIVPDVCSCREGFNGTNCTMAMCSQNCGPYGFCTRPNHCSCISGYTGGSSPCTPVCTNECLNGGTCTAPDTCTCPPGFTDPICNTKIVPASSSSSSVVVSMMMSSMSPSPTMSTSEPTDATTTADSGSQLSSSTIGAIIGGIVALVVIVVIIAVIIIIAAISC